MYPVQIPYGFRVWNVAIVENFIAIVFSCSI